MVTHHLNGKRLSGVLFLVKVSGNVSRIADRAFANLGHHITGTKANFGGGGIFED